MRLSEIEWGVTVALLVLLLGSACSSKASDEARLLAEDAFYALEGDPFSHETREAALTDIVRASRLDPDEPWVAIARSRAALEWGYRGGSRFRADNFNSEALETAMQFAREGVRLGPEKSMAYSQLARVQIVRGEYREAWKTLNSAHANDPESFYPWYFRSVISVQMRDRGRAEQAADEAEKRADNHDQQRFVLGQRKSIALAMGSEAEKEASYRAIIEHVPDSPYAYGNYGAFLLRRGRYQEAEAMLEKAVSNGAYPAAVEDLEEARNRGR